MQLKSMQFHLNSQENHNLATAGMPVIDCDGMAEWEIESSDDIKNILLSDEYHKVSKY